MVYINNGTLDSSRYYLQLSRDNDYNSLRIKSGYNAIIKEITREYQIPMVDLITVFDQVGRESLFVDHCHPNPTGHKIIAEQLARKIVKIYKQNILN